jgi:predicted phosphate transport protein (TIGR00153 family)
MGAPSLTGDLHMFGRFMPREGNFFEIFNAHARYIVDGSRELEKLIEDLGEAERHRGNIKIAEKSADKLTDECNDLLHKTFITPIDRDDIQKLMNGMDDIIDVVEDIANTITLYDVKALPDDAIEFARISTQTTLQVQQAVQMLSDMKQAKEIRQCCQEIDRLESEADRLLRTAISRLFREEENVKTLIKLKSVYELLETITDKCEVVSKIIEGILLENG